MAMCVVALIGVILRFGSREERRVNAVVSTQTPSSAAPDVSLVVINDTDTDISWLNETGALSRERVKLGKTDEQTRYSTPTEWVHKAVTGARPYVTAQTIDSFNTAFIECRIIVNGETIARQRASGPYAIATCRLE
jgi:hypothetical protein